MSLAECHARLAPILGPKAEPLGVLQRAEQHRAFWRPSRAQVILLAESHVYTSVEELNCQITNSFPLPIGLPRGFIRLVYCLGYGENSILDKPIKIPRNGGTPQFWKIFYSCLHEITCNHDFAPVQRASTPETGNRLMNKIRLLEDLREAGIWLLDASVAALYIPGQPKPSLKAIRSAIEISWDCHVGPLIQESEPVKVICIGRGVDRVLESRLKAIKCHQDVILQPNARLKATEHLQNFRRYYEVCQSPLWLKS